MSQEAVLIVNGRSRRGREWFPLAKAAFAEQGVGLKSASLTNSTNEMLARIRQAAEDSSSLICIGGGDGTLSAVAREFIERESILGILPMGTGNSLARDLRIPSSMSQAVSIIRDGVPTPIDLGEVNGSVFVNLATVGLTTLVAQNLTTDAKRRFGRAVYFVAMIKALAVGKRFNAKIELPDATLEHRSIQIIVGNGRFHGGPFAISPEASLDSGRLSGYTVNTSRRAILLQYAIRLWRGDHTEMPEVVPFRAPELTISTVPRKRITVDGDIKLATPAKFRVLPHAITVMAPREFTESQ